MTDRALSLHPMPLYMAVTSFYLTLLTLYIPFTTLYMSATPLSISLKKRLSTQAGTLSGFSIKLLFCYSVIKFGEAVLFLLE